MVRVVSTAEPRTPNLRRGEAHRAVRGVPCGSAMSMAATSSSAMLMSTPGDAGAGRRAAAATARPKWRATSVFDLIRCKQHAQTLLTLGDLALGPLQ